MVNHDQQRMPDSNRRLLPPSAEDKPLVLGRKVGVFAVESSMCCFHQGRTKPWAAFARLPAQPFASALLVAGAHAGPGREVPRIRKTAHVHSDLGQDHFGKAPLDPWDRRKSLDL